MSALQQLTVLYVLVGTGCGVVVAMRRGRGGLADALLVVPLWPLYGPFLLTQVERQTLSDPLRHARDLPLASLLPNPSTAGLLTMRLAAVEAKVREIHVLLAQPGFSEADATSRAHELEGQGDALAASMAQGRVQSIRRLRQLRERFARELSEVGELVAQLRVHAEVVRLAGADAAMPRELTNQIMARVDALGAVLDDDSRAAGKSS